MNETANTVTGRLRQSLLICGALSSLLYLMADITASLSWKNVYDYSSQSFSELMAFQAPTRPFVLSLNILYNILVIAVGISLFLMKGRKISLRITGILFAGYAVTGIVTPSFFPAPMRGFEATFRNTMHLPLTFLEVLFILLSIGFGSAALGKVFRLYSFLTFILLTACAFWGASFVPLISENQPTPWLGIIERGNIYGYLLWVMVFALTLLRLERSHRPIGSQNECTYQN